jgi:O-antigen/teichoic acid export membrane protein
VGLRPVLVALTVVTALAASAPAAAAGPRVGLVDLADGGPTSVRLRLDRDVAIVRPAEAQVVVARATAAGVAAVRAARARGAGAVLLVGPGAADLTELRVRVGGPLPAAAIAPPADTDWLGREVAWNSAPEIHERVRVEPGALPVRVEPGALPARVEPGALQVRVAARDGAPLVLATPAATGGGDAGGRGRLIVVAADLESDKNAPLHRWGYHAYLLRGLVAEAAGEAPPRFATWPPAPVPHGRAFAVWALVGVVLWVLALLGYVVARRRGRADPGAAHRFMAAVAAAGAGGGSAEKQARDRAWNRVGFVRPLSAYLLFMAIMLLALAPYVVLLTVVMGNWVQPFPEAEGLWRPLWETALFFWALFDMGTQTAFVKYFAEYRSSDAREAVRCVQFYFWWQVFSRLAQLTMVCGIAAYLPRTQYALFAHFLAVYGLVQLPGLVVGVKFVIQAVQRFDLQLALDLVEQRLAMYLVPIPFVFLFRMWGRANPEYGEAFGAAVGLAMGPQAAALLVAVIGIYFLKVRLRLPLAPLVLAQFTGGTARRLLLFGFKATLGQEPYRIANLVENLIIVGRLAMYQTWLGLRSVLNNLTLYVVLFGWSFFVSAVPALSEAYSAGKRRLCQYYLVRYLQFAHLFVAVLAGLLGAIGAPLIRDVMAPQWARAGDYILLAVAVILFLPFAWISDMLQQGSGRTGLNAIVMLIEQVIRIALFWLLIPLLQFVGMYVAILGTIALKCVVGWICNHVLIVKLRFYFWQMVAAPALAGLALYAVWRGVAFVPVFHGFWPVLVLFVVATPLSLLGGFFLMGLAGGFDAAAIEELEQAAGMSVTLRFAAGWFTRAGVAGHRLSPLRDRFPITIAAEAQQEAEELEAAAAAAARAEAG